MEHLPYNGTWVTCGAYAFLNGSGLPMEYLLAVENSCGATWGMACCGTNYEFTRILTPYRDFSQGIDNAAPLWGFSIVTTNLSSPSEMTLDYFPVGSTVMVGPINMERLTYLPLSRQYKLADHFILIKREQPEERLLVIDSEGIVGCYVEFERLKNMLCVQGIPEAQGMLQIRRLHKTGRPVAEKIIAEYTLEIAIKNLNEAENLGQGSMAFNSCCKTIQEAKLADYRNSLNYNLVYTMQRRIMALQFLDSLRKLKMIGHDHELYRGLTSQIEYIALCRKVLAEEEIDAICDQLNRLADAEKQLVCQWEGLKKNGWY